MSARQQEATEAYLEMWSQRFINSDGIAVWVDLEHTRLGKTAYTFDYLKKILKSRGWISKYSYAAWQLHHDPKPEKKE